MKIPSITQASVAATPTKDGPALEKASKEFESLLLKQLLSSAHVLGKEKGGYGDMAVDALAKGITDGGGIGLARQLQNMVQAAEMTTKKSATKE